MNSCCNRLAIEGAILAFVLFCAGMDAHAQNCPTEIVGALQLDPVMAGWTGEVPGEQHQLAGLSIFDGPMEEGVELVPLEKGKAHIWPFIGPVAGKVVWMRCWYRGSAAGLTRRVDPHVVLCFQKQVANPQNARQPVTMAMCVGSESKYTKTLRP